MIDINRLTILFTMLSVQTFEDIRKNIVAINDMKTITSDTGTRVDVPQGYHPVTTGTVQDGDLLWSEFYGWEPAIGGEIDASVTAFKAVARKP